MASIDNNLKDKDNKGISYADKRRAEKKVALREFIEAQQYLHAINADLEREILPDELNVVRFKTDTRLKLLNKILPDLKAVELSGDNESPIMHQIQFNIIDPKE